jgi:uncharacterized protein YlxW (UPF0749 family)
MRAFSVFLGFAQAATLGFGLYASQTATVKLKPAPPVLTDAKQNELLRAQRDLAQLNAQFANLQQQLDQIRQGYLAKNADYQKLVSEACGEGFRLDENKMTCGETPSVPAPSPGAASTPAPLPGATAPAPAKDR